jgi:integrase
MKGHVRKRGDAWHVFYDRPRGEDGRRRKSSKGPFLTKRAAQQWLATQLADMARGSFVEPSRQTFGEYLREDWLPSLDARGLRPNTLSGYKATIRKHVLSRPDIAGIALQRISPEILNRLYGALVASGLSARSVRYCHMILRQSLRDAERWGRIVKNPASLASPPAASAAARDAQRARHAWSADEVKAFLAHTRDSREHPLWQLAIVTGMRRGELCGLMWTDVDFERGRLSVVRTLADVRGEGLVVSSPKTTRGSRNLSLDAGSLATLREHRRKQAAEQLASGSTWDDSGEGYVFRNPDGSRISPNALSNHWRHVVRGSGLPVLRFHDLRHTSASLALAAGVHAKVTSERLGHSTISITLDLYSHAVPSLEADAADTIAGLVLGAGD